uniref:HERC2 ligase n=1 Tax=Dromaius novaehollandiae TaxID=8790 RepID=A0A8C4JCQ9_DRONO
MSARADFFCPPCEGGELFTWGQNAHGQLGVGGQVTCTAKPQLVDGLKGIALAHIAAGGAHSLVVSLSGAVYSWGKNDFGQLGLGHMEAYLSRVKYGKHIIDNVQQQKTGRTEY